MIGSADVKNLNTPLPVLHHGMFMVVACQEVLLQRLVELMVVVRCSMLFYLFLSWWQRNTFCFHSVFVCTSTFLLVTQYTV